MLLRKLPFCLGKPVRVNLLCGEILRIDKNGNQDRSTFNADNLLSHMYKPWMDFGFQSVSNHRNADAKDTYLDDLKSIAMFYGYYPEDIDALLADGFTTDDIEDMLYCG